MRSASRVSLASSGVRKPSTSSRCSQRGWSLAGFHDQQGTIAARGLDAKGGNRQRLERGAAHGLAGAKGKPRDHPWAFGVMAQQIGPPGLRIVGIGKRQDTDGGTARGERRQHLLG